MQESFPKVGIVVLTWNQRSLILDCLQSLSKIDYPNYLIIVIDNNSGDHSAEAVRLAYPQVCLIQNSVNLGFAGGNNLGIRHALEQGAEYVLLLNNDAIVERRAIGALMAAAMAHPDAGFFGPLICSLGDQGTILSAGGIFAAGWQTTHRGMGERDSSPYASLFEADYLSGCALLVSRKAIATTGVLDPDYYFYHEDVDWCYRGKKLGFKTLFVPNAKVWHPDTRTRDEFSARVTYYMARNALLFARKHHLKIQGLRLLLNDIRTILAWTFKPRWQKKRKQRNALVRAIADFLRGRVGPVESL
jgi:GT2 family glycosyltransferase